jgi:hypothetical protein
MVSAPSGKMVVMSDQQPDPGKPDPGTAPDGSAEDVAAGKIVVITPEGMGVASSPRGAGDDQDSREESNPADLVEQPAKVMRIGSMIKNLLDEVRNAPLDEAGRLRLAEIHRRSIDELKDGLAPELVAELDRIALPFGAGTPSDAELRIAQAQLVGWLEGLFHGIQTALVAQQMAAQQQLAGMRRALPPGHPDASHVGPGMPGGFPPGAAGQRGEQGHSGPTGQYL